MRWYCGCAIKSLGSQQRLPRYGVRPGPLFSPLLGGTCLLGVLFAAGARPKCGHHLPVALVKSFDFPPHRFCVPLANLSTPLSGSVPWPPPQLPPPATAAFLSCYKSQSPVSSGYLCRLQIRTLGGPQAFTASRTE